MQNDKCISGAAGTEANLNKSGNSEENTSGGSDGMAPSQPVGPSQFSQGSQPLSQFRGGNMPANIRAHAFVTLGRKLYL